MKKVFFVKFLLLLQKLNRFKNEHWRLNHKVLKKESSSFYSYTNKS